MKSRADNAVLADFAAFHAPFPGWSHTFMRAPIPFFALRSFVPCSLMLFLCVTAIGCSDDDKSQDIQPLQCRLNSDCGAGQICVESACVEDSEACQGPDCPCASAADCGVGQGCDIGTGSCFDLECLGDRDCPLGQVCISGRCDTDLEADRDRDGVPDNEDRCPDIEDADQQDSDGDLQGNACDTDDDNDAVPDTIDNCPLTPNPVQGDIDGDQQGNACDPDASHIDVRGALDFSQLPGADTSLARVFISGLDAPINIEPNGDFLIDEALAEPSRFNITVRWPGFVPIIQEFTAGDGAAMIDVGTLEMTPQVQGDGTVQLGGAVQLEAQNQHRDIIVRARVGGSLFATTLTDDQGNFDLSAPPVDLTLEFVKEGFETLSLDLEFNTALEGDGRFTVNDVPFEDIDDLVLEQLTGTASVAVVVEPDWLPQGQRAVTVTVVGGGHEDSKPANGTPVNFTDLPAGDYIIFADRPGFSLGRQPFTISQDQPDANIELTVSLTNLSDANIDLSGVTLSGDDLRQVANLTNADLSGVTIAQDDPETPAELCNLDLSGVSLANADLTGVNLAGSNLTGARLDNATMTGADLRAADLTNASLFGTNLAQTDLQNGAYECQGEPQNGGRTLLRGANFNAADLTDARFTPGDAPADGDPCTVAAEASPDMAGVRWTQTNLTRAVLHNADFNNADLSSTIIASAYLQRACMTDATFLRADLTDADLTDADLTGANLIDTLARATHFNGATLTGVGISGSNLEDAELKHIEGDSMTVSSAIVNGATFEDANLQRSSWIGALLDSVSLAGATLDHADLRNAELTDVTLTGASFESADARNANLFQLDLSQLNFSNALLDGANLNSANLTHTNFTGARLQGTTFNLARYSADTLWPAGFEFRTIEALGPETLLGGVVLPNGLNLVDIDLTDADLTGTNLTGANLTGANLTGTQTHDLTGCPELLPTNHLCVAQPNNNRSAIVGPNVDLTSADLTGADLTGADLQNATLNQTQAHDLTGCPALLPADHLCVNQPANNRKAIVNPDADLTGADLTGADLTSANMAGANLTDALLASSFFTNADLTGANMAGADLTGANLRNALLVEADLAGADIIEANLTGANLTSADLTGADLTDTDLTNANLINARLHNLRGCPLVLPNDHFCVEQPANNRSIIIGPTVDLTGANITGVDLSGISIQRADLTNTRAYDLVACPELLPTGYLCRYQPDNDAHVLVGPNIDLRNAVIKRINLSNVDLTGANLRNANIQNANLTGANFTSATLTNTFLKGTILTNTNFTDALLIGANLIDTTLTDADFTGANLTNARSHSQEGCPARLPVGYACRDANRQKILIGPNINASGTRLDGADFAGLDLTNTDFTNDIMINADLSNTNLSDANLTGVDLTGADLTDATFSDQTVCPDGQFQADLLRCGL